MPPIAAGVGEASIIPPDKFVEVIEQNKDSDRRFWSGEKVRARVLVELPFWLMTPDSTYDIQHEKTTLQVQTLCRHLEVASHALFLDSRDNLVTLGIKEEIEGSNAWENAEYPLQRFQKTVVQFSVDVLQQAFADYQSDVAYSANRSRHYFTAYARSLLPFLNRLVTAYRSATRDPFAYDLSDWDVPFWWFKYEGALGRGCLMPYFFNDYYPAITTFGTEERTDYVAATPEHVASCIKDEMSPGSKQILDAISLMYRGRYSDAIRTVVTAIEVVLEASLLNEYRASGLDDERAREETDRTRDSFHKRLEDYTRITRKRLPGPRPSHIPYLNGVRLADELEWVRDCRNQIVHQAYRVGDRGLALRAIETMTWLYDWFSDDEIDPEQGTKNYELYSMMRGLDHFRCDYREDGLLVIDPTLDLRDAAVAGDDIPLATEIIDQQFDQTLEPPKGDLDLQVAMAFYRFEIDLEDGPAVLPEDAVPMERYRWEGEQVLRLIFCFTSTGSPKEKHIRDVADRVKQVEGMEEKEVKPLLVFHHESTKERASRAGASAVDRGVEELARKAGVGLVLATELSQLVYGVSDDVWRSIDALSCLSVSGRCGTPPPTFSEIGVVKNYLSNNQVLIVTIGDGRKVSLNDEYCLETTGRYQVGTIDSIQINGAGVIEAEGPVEVGIATTLPGKLIRKKAKLFARTPSPTS